jgi:hypothetical protein
MFLTSWPFVVFVAVTFALYYLIICRCAEMAGPDSRAGELVLLRHIAARDARLAGGRGNRDLVLFAGGDRAAQCRACYLYQLQTLAALEQTRYVRTTRLALANAFSGARWLQLDYPAAEIRWDDAIHFNDRSAIILACALERALNSKSGN